MCTMSAIRHNPVVSHLYNRLVDRGVLRQKARIACIRKLLKLAWGCAKNLQMFGWAIAGACDYEAHNRCLE